LGVGLVVSEHGVEDVGAAAGEGDEGLVVFFLLSSFAVVVGPRNGVAQGGERGEEQGSFEDLVAAAGWVFSADGDPGSAGDGGQARRRRPGARRSGSPCRRPR
jgi:hypothetical protein